MFRLLTAIAVLASSFAVASAPVLSLKGDFPKDAHVTVTLTSFNSIGLVTISEVTPKSFLAAKTMAMR